MQELNLGTILEELLRSMTKFSCKGELLSRAVASRLRQRDSGKSGRMAFRDGTAFFRMAVMSNEWRGARGGGGCHRQTPDMFRCCSRQDGPGWRRRRGESERSCLRHDMHLALALHSSKEQSRHVFPAQSDCRQAKETSPRSDHTYSHLREDDTGTSARCRSKRAVVITRAAKAGVHVCR